MSTIIDNTTIRDFVQKYVSNMKNELPPDLAIISNWDVSNVTNMSELFVDCEHFDEPLDSWNVSNVTNMSGMFAGCLEFNQPLNSWNVSRVTDTSGMFKGCVEFDQPLNSWNVSRVTDMSGMFEDCEKFNQSLNNWNVANVTNMDNMFKGCENFNKPLNGWIVTAVVSMNSMFEDCESFDQPLTNWNVDNVMEFSNIFEGCPIDEDNKPGFDIDHNDENAQDVRVDAMQVHRASANINYEKLKSFLSEKLQIPFPANVNFARKIYFTIALIINESGAANNIIVEQNRGLNRIMSERLDRLDYNELSLLMRETIFYVLE
jgi:surface protein